jgi:P pilus assembly chaperone PapD
MKKNTIFILGIFILLFSQIKAQVIISPYVVYTDEQNKFGSLIVQNESYDPYEITISFIFGYPVSDSLGNRTMEYIREPKDSLPSINNWVKAFPKKFILQPKERQTVRLLIKPPQNIKDGTYWTRLVTSSAPVVNEEDTANSGVSAKLRFVLNQVTTVIFRKGIPTANLIIKNVKLHSDSTNTYQLLYSLKREGNSPYFGYLNLKIYNLEGELIKEESDYTSIYFDITRNYILPKDKFPAGRYKAEFEAVFNEKEDMPKSKMKPIANVKKTFEFIIP